MFNLLILPTEAHLERLKKQYPELDCKSVMSFLMLLRTATELSSALDKSLMKYGLLQNRWLILVILMREETHTLSPTALTKVLGITGATLSRLLETLEEEGHVKRNTCKTDRRAHEISLTAKGQKLLNKVMPEYYASITKVFAKMTEQQHKDLSKALQAIDPSKLYES